MYYICWKNEVTGVSGRGTKAVTKATARAWWQVLLSRNDDMTYWLEKA